MKLSEAMGNPLQDYLLLGQLAKVAFCSMAMDTIWAGRLYPVEEQEALLRLILATKNTTWLTCLQSPKTKISGLLSFTIS